MIKQVYRRLSGKGGYNHRHKMCPSCGKFVASGDIKCPYCQAPIGHIHVVKNRAKVESDGKMETVYLLFGICLFFYILEAVNSMKAMQELGSAAIPARSIFSVYWAPEEWVTRLMGSNFAPATWGGDIWRLIQYNFLHGGILHIGFNLYALAALGPMIQQSFGTRRFWVIVLMTGILGGVMSTARALVGFSSVPSIGVSGALFGMIGALWAFYKSQGNVVAAAHFKKIMIQANLFCFIVSIAMPIDNLAHLGGMFSGIGLGFLLYRYASFKKLIFAETLFLLAVAATWIWGMTTVYYNLTHMRALAGL